MGVHRKHYLKYGEEDKRNELITKLFYKDKISQKLLAERFGISTSSISRIIKRGKTLEDI